MGNSKCGHHHHSSIISLYVLLCAVLLLNAAHRGSCGSCYKRIFTFGDSIIDTGNFVHSVGGNPCPIKNPPFGMTFFHHPAGRVSDGRVLIDFYAQGLGLPLVPPSLPGEKSAQFPTGANFAVFAATAMPAEYFRKWNKTIPGSACLGTQFDWFKEVLGRIAPGDGNTRRLLSESIIMLGEIGGNDYNFWFMDNRPRDVAYSFIPDVVGRISFIAQELIGLGAKTIMIPGNFPVGCVPAYLNAHRSSNPADYDESRCLRWFNDFSARHNQALLGEIGRLRAQHPGVKLIYADYFAAAMKMVRNPGAYGIGDPLVACCGGDGPYHTGKTCGVDARLWGNPAGFMSWDGLHMTEKAYHGIADGVLNGPFANPPLLHSC